jgi:hypothetical protein
MLPGSIVVKYKSFFLNAPAISQNLKYSNVWLISQKVRHYLLLKDQVKYSIPKPKRIKHLITT